MRCMLLRVTVPIAVVAAHACQSCDGVIYHSCHVPGEAQSSGVKELVDQIHEFSWDTYVGTPYRLDGERLLKAVLGQMIVRTRNGASVQDALRCSRQDLGTYYILEFLEGPILQLTYIGVVPNYDGMRSWRAEWHL